MEQTNNIVDNDQNKILTIEERDAIEMEVVNTSSNLTPLTEKKKNPMKRTSSEAIDVDIEEPENKKMRLYDEIKQLKETKKKLEQELEQLKYKPLTEALQRWQKKIESAPKGDAYRLKIYPPKGARYSPLQCMHHVMLEKSHNENAWDGQAYLNSVSNAIPKTFLSSSMTNLKPDDADLDIFNQFGLRFTIYNTNVETQIKIKRSLLERDFERMKSLLDEVSGVCQSNTFKEPTLEESMIFFQISRQSSEIAQLANMNMGKK